MISQRTESSTLTARLPSHPNVNRPLIGSHALPVWCCQVCGSMPFDDTDVKKMIRHQTERKVAFSSRHWRLSTDVKQLIHGILEPRVDRRFSVDDVRQSAWMSATTTTDHAHATTTDSGHAATTDRAHATTADRAHTTTTERGNATKTDRAHTTTADRAHITTTDRAHPTTADRAHATTTDRAHTTKTDKAHTTTTDRAHATTTATTTTANAAVSGGGGVRDEKLEACGQHQPGRESSFAERRDVAMSDRQTALPSRVNDDSGMQEESSTATAPVRAAAATESRDPRVAASPRRRAAADGGAPRPGRAPRPAATPTVPAAWTAAFVVRDRVRASGR